MKKERKKIWNIPPEEEQTGLLFWFQLLQKHYFTLCCANGIALASLELPQFVRTAQKAPYVGNIKF